MVPLSGIPPTLRFLKRYQPTSVAKPSAREALKVNDPVAPWLLKLENGSPGLKFKYWYIPDSSYRGTSMPGARVSEAVGPGNGVGLGVAGKANTPFVATGLLVPMALPEGASFSAFAAALVVSWPAPLLFCCA